MKETKEYGSIRKLKAYGACGVMLCLSVLMLSVASTTYADEVQSRVVKTEVVSTVSNENVDTISVPVDSSIVENAVSEAKTVGVTVIQDSTVDKVVAEEQLSEAKTEVAQEQAKMVAEIEKTTADYNQKKAEYEKTVEEVTAKNKVIEAENMALKEASEGAQKAYEQVATHVEESKEAVKKEFSEAKVTIETKTIEVDPASASSMKAYTAEVEKIGSENRDRLKSYLDAKNLENKEIAEAESYNQAVRQRNKDGQAKVDAENKEIDAFNEAVKKYNQSEDERVKKEKAQAQENSTKDGYTKEIVSKYLVFGRENTKQARLVSVTGVEFISQKKYWEQVAISGNNVFNVLPTNWDHLVVDNKAEATSDNGSVLGRLTVGKTAVVRYEGLDASYDGKKIVAVEYYYTPKSANSSYGKVNANFDGISTNTILAGTLKGSEGFEMELEVRFFGEDGQEILPEAKKPFLYSVASMNSYGEGTSHVEFAKISSADQFIPINGSYVQRYGDMVYSKTDLENPAALGLNQAWDREDSPVAYVGAGLVSTDKRIRFSFGVETNGNHSGITSEWFAFNTDFKTSVVNPAVYKQPKEHVSFTPEKEKTVPTPKVELTLVMVTPPPAPVYQPKEELPEPPAVPTVHYHHVRLAYHKKEAELVQVEKKVLPQTGTATESASMLTGVFFLCLSFLGYVAHFKKSEK